MKKEKNEVFRKIFILLTILFLVIGIYNIGEGMDKKEKYTNSEYSGINVNSYVGGDAYNYIINGTYFTAYYISGAIFIGCSLISLGFYTIMYVNDKEDEKLPSL